MLDYGDLSFDSLMLATEIQNLIETNTMGKDLKDRILDQMDKGVHAKTMFSETQKAFLICSTNLLIHSAAKYIITHSLPVVLKEMKEKAEAQGADFDETSPDIKTTVSNLILAEEGTVKRIETMVNNVITASKERIKEMNPDEIHIDRLYGLPEGASVNIALELFVAVTAENELFKTYTHVLLIDDVHGTFTPVQLDPKVVSFEPRLEETEEEVNV